MHLFKYVHNIRLRAKPYIKTSTVEDLAPLRKGGYLLDSVPPNKANLYCTSFWMTQHCKVQHLLSF